MKTSSTIRLAVMSGAVALVLVLGAGAAQAFEVLHDGSNATGIQNLVVGSSSYNVTFVFDTAENVYGPEPGVYDFADALSAEEAAEEVVAALNTVAEVTTVGSDATIEWNIGFGFENDFALVAQGFYFPDQSQWAPALDTDIRPFLSPRTYADFNDAVPVAPSTWSQIKALYDK